MQAKENRQWMNAKRTPSDLSAKFGAQHTSVIMLCIGIRFCPKVYTHSGDRSTKLQTKKRKKEIKRLQTNRTRPKSKMRRRKKWAETRTEESQYLEFIHSSSSVYCCRLFRPLTTRHHIHLPSCPIAPYLTLWAWQSLLFIAEKYIHI